MKDPSNLLIGQADGTFTEGAEEAGVLSFAKGRGAGPRRPQPRRPARPRRGRLWWPGDAVAERRIRRCGDARPDGPLARPPAAATRSEPRRDRRLDRGHGRRSDDPARADGRWRAPERRAGLDARRARARVGCQGACHLAGRRGRAVARRAGRRVRHHRARRDRHHALGIHRRTDDADPPRPSRHDRPARHRHARRRCPTCPRRSTRPAWPPCASAPVRAATTGWSCTRTASTARTCRGCPVSIRVSRRPCSSSGRTAIRSC